METFSALLASCARNSPMTGNSPYKGQCRGALMFSLICAPINGWVSNREAGDLRHHRAHYDVTVMMYATPCNDAKNFVERSNFLFLRFSTTWNKIYSYYSIIFYFNMSKPVGDKWRIYALMSQIMACRLVGAKPLSKKCGLIVNCTFWNKCKWNLNWNTTIFIQENAFEIVVCEMAVILSRV